MLQDKEIGIVGVRYTGTFNINNKYEFLNMVTHEGSTYICINQNGAEGQAITNTEYWILSAQKGTDGINGTNATINGVSTIEIEEGSNIHITQIGSKLIISTTGVQNEITNNNKLNSDLVDDTNKNNKFVTTQEKQTWNGKAEISDITSAVGTEIANRQSADNNLQRQIDAIVSASDVVDVISSYTELQNYDTSKITADDVIKVMQDSSHNNAISYFRWVITNNVGAWTYVGSEGPFFTKAEVEELVNAKYSKPNAGIPKTDLDNSVQASLNKADTALQQHQDISGKENSSNKTDTISSSSTNIQYPGALAVYTYVNGIVGDINTLLDTLNRVEV